MNYCDGGGSGGGVQCSEGGANRIIWLFHPIVRVQVKNGGAESNCQTLGSMSHGIELPR